MARNVKNTRMCAGCMARMDKSVLISVCKNEKGIFFGYGFQKEKGRSVYLCANAECMEKSIKKKSFSRSFKCELQPDFYEDLKTFTQEQIKSTSQG